MIGSWFSPGFTDNDEETSVLRNGRGSKYSSRIMIAVVAALIPMVAGCEAGNNAPVLHWHPPTDGTGKTIGNITISNAFVLGAPIGQELPASSNAGLFLGLVNDGDATDRLVSASAPGVAQSVQLPGNRVVLSSQHAVLLAGPQPQIILTNLTKPLTGGSVVSITLNFAIAGQVTIKVPVMPRAQYFTTLRPAPAPTTPSGSPTPGGTSTPTPSGSPTPSPSSS
ncbi:MAG TPA: copper chaperone PCu(A)C [Streptosporangiaceae bacterium]|nr:copper chaperone PCu(A)C [Streptosporangiaceae bacterium]